MHKKAAKLNPFESFYQEGVSLAVYEKVKKTSGQEKIAWIKETIEETEKAIRLNPANGFFYNTMGVCHGVLAKQGVDREINEKKAIEFYKKAISLTPKLTEAYNNLALLLMAQGKLDEAQEKLKQALEIGAGRYGTDASSYKLGQKLLDQGKTEEAINLFKEVVKWRKKDTDALRNLAVAYSKAGQNSKAIEIFERVLEIDPKNDYAKKAIKKIKENVGISVN
jgi:tetratricopeptide (TPR) repeat protein